MYPFTFQDAVRRMRQLHTIKIRGTANKPATTITVKARNYDTARQAVLDKTGNIKLPCGVKAQLQKIYK